MNCSDCSDPPAATTRCQNPASGATIILLHNLTSFLHRTTPIMDTNPRMPAAGVAHVGDTESTAYCVQPDLDPRRDPSLDDVRGSNPDQLKWRTSYRREPVSVSSTLVW